MSFFKTCTAFQTKKSKVLWQAWKPRPSLPCHLCFGKLLLQPNAHERRGSIDCYQRLYKTPDMFCNSPLNSNNTTLWAKMSNERCQDECVPRFWAYGSFQFSAFLTVARNLSLKFWYKTRILKEQFESCAASKYALPEFLFLGPIMSILQNVGSDAKNVRKTYPHGVRERMSRDLWAAPPGGTQGILGHHH